MDAPTLPEFTPEEVETALRLLEKEDTFSDQDMARVLLRVKGVEELDDVLMNRLTNEMEDVLRPHSIGSVLATSEEGMGWTNSYETYLCPSGAAICVHFEDDRGDCRIGFLLENPTNKEMLEFMVNEWFDFFEDGRWTGGEIEFDRLLLVNGKKYLVTSVTFWERVFGFPWLPGGRRRLRWPRQRSRVWRGSPGSSLDSP